MCVLSSHKARVRINTGKVANPARGQLNRGNEMKMNISLLSPFAPENWSRETDSAVPSRQPAYTIVCVLQQSESIWVALDMEKGGRLLLLFVYFQVNNGVVYLDYEDSHHHGPLLCSFQ